MPTETIRFRCEKCFQELAASSLYAGQPTVCVRCKTPLLVPGTRKEERTTEFAGQERQTALGPAHVPVPMAIPVNPPKAPAELDGFTVAAIVATTAGLVAHYLPDQNHLAILLCACGLVLGFCAGHQASLKNREASRAVFWCLLISAIWLLASLAATERMRELWKRTIAINLT